LGTTYRAVLALICILFVLVVCGVADSSLVPVPWDVGSTCRGWIPAYLKELATAPGGSLDWDLDLNTTSARER
jgi:hypothetical protein